MLKKQKANARISRKYRISEIARQSADSFPWDQIRGITINQKLADNKISLIICLGVWQVGSHYTLPPFFPGNLHPSKILLVGKWADPSRWTPFEASIDSGAFVQMSLIVLKSWFRFDCAMWIVGSSSRDGANSTTIPENLNAIPTVEEKVIIKFEKNHWLVLFLNEKWYLFYLEYYCKLYNNSL